MDTLGEKRTFFWDETETVVGDLLATEELRVDGSCLVGETVRVRPPLVLPVSESVTSARQYLDELPTEPGLQLVILLQAGAAALGLFDRGEPLRTKAIKKYVVRGRGKAQPTHLRTKGKSRYGSRLRLQNAKALLVEVNEKLIDWFDEYGEPEQVFTSCPVRMWPELFQVKPPPPFDRHASVIRIPRDLPVPTTDVMLRAYRSLCYGSVEPLGADAGAGD